MRWLACGILVISVLLGQMAWGDDKQDPKDWTPIKIPGQQAAPEFEDIEDWVNSKPLTMKSLKGNVVVVHFMAFA